MLNITFDGTFDGFLSVVYAVYYEKLSPVTIQEEGAMQLTLNETAACYVDTDVSKAARVFKALREKISEEAAYTVYTAFLAEGEGRCMALLEYIKLGFKVSHMVDSHLGEDFVRVVHGLAKGVQRESHLLYGFCRFAQTKSGVYYCGVTPRNNVLEMLAEYFSGRFLGQAWVIHDKSRDKAAVFDGQAFLITEVPREVNVDFAEGEERTQELWVSFFNTLAIEQRKNPKLQRQLLPLYFRKNMTEFK